MATAASFDRLLPWVLRLAWVGVLVTGDAAIDGATATRSETIGAVATWGAGAFWVLGVAAMALPAVVSLTATRALVPLSIPVAVVTWAAGADALDGGSMLSVAALTTIVAYSGEIGRVFVQASAYGEEDRHLLRPPAGYLLAVLVSWTVWAGALIGAMLLLAAQYWILGAALSAATIGLSAWAWPRWHRLSRRWFVVVPIGLVVHDHLVLAETLMLRRQEIAAVRLARTGTGAADLTGPAGGHAVEITTVEPVTVILAATPSEPGGKAIHLTGCLVAPTRPGRALQAVGRRDLPVG